VTREYYTEGEYVPGTSATAYFYGIDNLGSVRRVFYTGGAPTYDYDPYGNPLQTTPPVTDFGYAGMFLHAASGLYLTTYRAYDPYSGRWLSRDPAEELDGGINLYGYVGESPVNEIDPWGLQELLMDSPPIYDPDIDNNPSPFMPSDPYSPESTSGRQSGMRDNYGLNRDPDSPIPDDPSGSMFKPEQCRVPARGRTPHSTGERNVNPNEEHSIKPKGGPRGGRIGGADPGAPSPPVPCPPGSMCA
jgi:RHS repeat-associated protein